MRGWFSQTLEKRFGSALAARSGRERTIEACLHVENLSAGYVRGVEILQAIDFGAREGAITAIIGPNGAGKSTLLKSVMGLVPHLSGAIWFEDIDVTGQAPWTLIERGVSFVPQEHTVFPEMTVHENLVMGAWSRRHDKRWIVQRIDHLSGAFPLLSVRARDTAADLSGGQQRMVEIARALMTEPSVLLLDEPTVGLPPPMSAEIYATLSELNSTSGMTIVLVDQNARDALKIAHHAYVLAMGRNDCDGPAADIDAKLDDIVRRWLRIRGSGLTRG